VPQLILCGADPFGFDRVHHLHWPLQVEEEVEEGAGKPAPWPSRLMPSRWAYQAAVTSVRDAPELEGVFEERALVKTYNVAKKNVELWRTDEAAFFDLLSGKMGSPVDEALLRERLQLIMRGGYRLPEEVEEVFGDLAPGAAGTEVDLAPLMNITFQDYAEKGFPVRQEVLGADLPVRRGSLRIISLMALGFLVTSSISLTINRRIFGKP
jgi:hypothetical protein